MIVLQLKGATLGFLTNLSTVCGWKGFCHSRCKKLNVTDETDLARQLFVKMFSQELEEKPNDIYCTKVDGKELLHQS